MATAVGVLLTPSAAQAVRGGAPAGDGAHPFVAKIDTGGASCSGALVHAQWVVTLKSCFHEAGTSVQAGPPPTPTTATIGRTDLGGTTGVRVAVDELSPHPTLDVVLARLAEPVSGIAPVALGGPPVAGETLRVAGYGRTDSEWVPDRLRTVTATVGTVTGAAFTVATTADVSTCLGDGGGPAFRETSGQSVLVGLHSGSRQRGCLAETATDQGGTEIRADVLDGWLRQHVEIPQAFDLNSGNLARDATFTASSSAQNWGWFLADVNDGVRTDPGWTSWPPSDTPRTEWLEFAFPGARQVNRVDLYPRTDQPVAQNNFPANFTIDVWTGSAWETVVSRTNYPKPSSGRGSVPDEVHHQGAGAGHRFEHHAAQRG